MLLESLGVSGLFFLSGHVTSAYERFEREFRVYCKALIIVVSILNLERSVVEVLLGVALAAAEHKADLVDELNEFVIPRLEDPLQPLVFSVVSLWEVAIKSSLGRADFHVEGAAFWLGLLGQVFFELSVRIEILSTFY